MHQENTESGYIKFCLLGRKRFIQVMKTGPCFPVVTKTLVQFSRIHTISLVNVEKILNRRITKFYNGDDVNVIPAESQLTKTRPTYFYKKHNLL